MLLLLVSTYTAYFDKSAPAQPAAFGDRQEFGALFQSVHSGGLVLAVAANPAHCGLVAD